MTEESKKTEKSKRRRNRFWVYDPSAFQPLPRASFFKRRILAPIRSLGKYALFALAFSYPVLLVSLGIVFGGLVFWISLGGSVALMWLIIRKAGYARNFADWGVGSRRFLGLFGAFGLVLAFFYGFTHLGNWFIPIFMVVLISSFVVGLTFHSRE